MELKTLFLSKIDTICFPQGNIHFNLQAPFRRTKNNDIFLEPSFFQLCQRYIYVFKTGNTDYNPELISINSEKEIRLDQIQNHSKLKNDPWNITWTEFDLQAIWCLKLILPEYLEESYLLEAKKDFEIDKIPLLNSIFKNFAKATTMDPISFYYWHVVSIGKIFSWTQKTNYLQAIQKECDFAGFQRITNSENNVIPMTNIPLLDTPLKKSSFAFSNIMLPTLPEAAFLNSEEFIRFTLVNSSCKTFNTGDIKCFKTDTLYLSNNPFLEELPDIKYEVREILIVNCPSLKKFPKDWYNHEDLTITHSGCFSLETKVNAKCTIIQKNMMLI